MQRLIEIEILDFEETYSPMIELTTIRVVLAIGITSSQKIKQLDMIGFLNEIMYMEQQLSFKSSASVDHMCKLNRSFYGKIKHEGHGLIIFLIIT